MQVVPRAFYNEIDPFAAHLLRRLIGEGVIAPGVVSEKSIKEITADDLRGFTQVHLFAGGGLWSVAARQAGWADERPLWTASCPCQPFSQAGQGRGADDPRHLWPDVDRLVHECRAAGFGPSVLVGEQVAGAAGYHWFDGVRTDLAQQGYGARVVDIPACAVDAPHIRQRLYWVALADGGGESRQQIARGASGNEAAYGRSRRVGEQPDGDNRHRRDDEGSMADSTGQRRDAAALAGIRGEAQGERSWYGKSERLHGVQRDMAEPAGDGREQGEPRTSAARYGREPSAAHGGINEAMADAHRGGRAGRPEAQKRGAIGRTAAERPSYASWFGVCWHPSCRDSDRRDCVCDGLGAPDGWVWSDDDGWVEHAERPMWQGQSDAERIEARPARRPDAERADRRDSGRNGSFWADAEWLICHDGKARRTKPGLRLLVDGLPRRVDLWRVAGNAIVVAEAREVIAALMDVIDGAYVAPRFEPFPRDLFEGIA